MPTFESFKEVDVRSGKTLQSRPLTRPKLSRFSDILNEVVARYSQLEPIQKAYSKQLPILSTQPDEHLHGFSNPLSPSFYRDSWFQSRHKYLTSRFRWSLEQKETVDFLCRTAQERSLLRTFQDLQLAFVDCMVTFQAMNSSADTLRLPKRKSIRRQHSAPRPESGESSSSANIETPFSVEPCLDNTIVRNLPDIVVIDDDSSSDEVSYHSDRSSQRSGSSSRRDDDGPLSPQTPSRIDRGKRTREESGSDSDGDNIGSKRPRLPSPST